MAELLDLRDRLKSASGTKAINRKQVLLAVAVKPGTQADLARRTGLSPGTVSAVFREFQQENVLTAGRGEQGGVRRTVVCLRPARNVAVGVHLGFNHVAVVARRIDQPIERTCAVSFEGGVNRGLPDILHKVEAAVKQAVTEVGRTERDVISLGMAVPGMIDPRTGEFANPLIPPWRRGDRPARKLAERLGVLEVVDNDATLGALAEQTYNTDGDAELVVYIKAATGIGAGMVLANTPVRGRHGIAGEIGHLVMDPGGEVCYCGGRGCLGTLIGAEALVRQVRDSPMVQAADAPRSLPDLILKARNGDAVCRRVLQDAGRMLGRAVGHVCNILNPDVIVLGGDLANAQDLVLAPCRQSLEQCTLSGATEDLVLKTSAMGQLTEAQGALVLGLAALGRRDDPQDPPTD
jgi:predicted NBD/HSP70 family sugar kinase